jgi:hypothetical protein
MSERPPRIALQCLVTAAVVLTMAGVVLVPMAFARIVRNTIDPVAIVADGGRLIVVTGPIECTPSERAHLRVTVTQRATGALAEGHTRITCTGGSQQWELHASTHGSESFQEGPAIAVAVARTTHRGDITDAHQWLVDVTLVGD